VKLFQYDILFHLLGIFADCYHLVFHLFWRFWKTETHSCIIKNLRMRHIELVVLISFFHNAHQQGEVS
jgi:hypothetical protein